MYIKIILSSLLIAVSESSFFGITKSETPLRRIVPLMMDANDKFNSEINRALLNRWVPVPLYIPEDTFVAGKVFEKNFSMNVEDIAFVKMQKCKVVNVEADLLIQFISITSFCNEIISEGQYELDGNSKQSLRGHLKGVQVEIGIDLKQRREILVIESITGKATYTLGVVFAPTLTRDMKEAAVYSLFKNVLEKKIVFYFKIAMENMLQYSLGSINIMDYLSYDDTAISLFKVSNLQLSKMVNGILDQKIKSFIKNECEDGYFPVANLNLTFQKRPFLITYRGSIHLMDGMIGNFKTFEKIGKLALFGNLADGKFVVLIKFHMGEAFAYFEDMYTNIWNYRFIHFGGVKGFINSFTAEVGIDISLNMMGFVAEVNEVVLFIPQMGELRTKIRSLGILLGFLASFMQSLVTGLFHFIFVWIFEKKIENFLNENLVGKKIELMG